MNFTIIDIETLTFDNLFLAASLLIFDLKIEEATNEFMTK
jgi:hypothetical protein